MTTDRDTAFASAVDPQLDRSMEEPIATPGVGYPEARVHAPNENLVIEHFVGGTKYMSRLLDRFARG